ncbi:MAG TPA: uracil-DNA glycosylase [Terriglobales bacterium]|nr:uracil-DNA glycosylase [Terriglobales bacterium]
MPRTLDPETKQALAARLRYYRDMGIYDFYRRAGSMEESQISSQPATAQELKAEATVTVLKSETMDLDPAAALRLIRQDLGDCTRCKLHKQGRKQIVFGVGNPRAELMFVGEGPGADEDLQGEPFVGRAGQLLNKMIEAMGLKRDDVYIANVVKCRPPGNRTPEKDECDTCSPFLMRQVDVIRPKAIVALGAVAAKTLLGVADSMNNLRQRSYDFRGTRLFVTYHPAYLLRDPRQKAEAWKDLQTVMSFLGLHIPHKD